MRNLMMERIVIGLREVLKGFFEFLSAPGALGRLIP